MSARRRLTWTPWRAIASRLTPWIVRSRSDVAERPCRRDDGGTITSLSTTSSLRRSSRLERRRLLERQVRGAHHRLDRGGVGLDHEHVAGLDAVVRARHQAPRVSPRTMPSTRTSASASASRSAIVEPARPLSSGTRSSVT
jgi:hypothetical protein